MHGAAETVGCEGFSEWLSRHPLFFVFWSSFMSELTTLEGVI